jgi:hypothetical protein
MTLQRNETITKKTVSKDFKERMRAKERGQEQENSNYLFKISIIAIYVIGGTTPATDMEEVTTYNKISPN